MNRKGKGAESYADIIGLPHHISCRHPQMPAEARAAQFAPFAALNGYEEAVRETARLTESRPEMDETHREAMDRKLMQLQQTEPMPDVEIVYFVPDERKAGGMNVSVRGRIGKIDRNLHRIVMDSGTEIPAENVVEIRVWETADVQL